MSKLVRRKKEIGAALIVALQLATVTLIGLMLPFGSGPHPVKAPADSQVSAAQPQTQTVQAGTVQPLTPADKSALRKSAVFAKKLQEPLASQVFTLATSRAESAEQAQQSAEQSMQQGEAPTGATLTTDQEDYPPFSYVYFTGTGFQPGETVNMIVVELDPVQQSFEPWDVVADENGNFQTSWYVFSEEFRGATFQATATGDTSGLNASATFTDGCVDVTVTSIDGNPVPTPKPIVTLTTLPHTINVLFNYDTHGTVGTTTATVELVGASPAVTNGPITISSGAHTGQLITLPIPSGTTNGIYNIKVSLIYDDGTHGNCQGNDNVSQGVNINVASSPTPTATATATAASPTPTPTATATATFSPTPTPTPTPTCNPPSVTLNPTNQTVTYGAASVSFTATASGTPAPTVQWQVNTGSGFTDIGGETSTTLTISNPTVAMSGYQYQAVFTSSCPPGTATSSAATLTVNPAPLEITANSFSKQYGLTYSFTGTEYTISSGTLYNGDTVSSVALSSAGAAATATVVAPGPTYTITAGPGVTFSVGSAGNYNISFVNGTLTVTEAPLEITANSFSKQYGLTYSFTGSEYTVSNGTLYNGDTISSVALSSAGAAATATVVAPGPTYTITAGSGVTFSVGNAGNYNVSFVDGTLTVTAAPLQITANSFSKQYGLTYSFIGSEYSITNGTLYNGDTISSVTLSSAGAAATATVVAPGPTYTITTGPASFSAGNAGNYNISFVNGTLTVTAAPLQITANSFSKQYGLTYSFAGTEYTISNGTLYNGDTISSVALSSAGAAATATVVAPGPTYAITAGPGVTFSVGSAGNYNISFVSGTLTITAAPLQITANSFSKQYGLTYSFAGTEYTISNGTLYNGDTISSVALSSAGAANTATVVTPGPTYTITAGPGVTFSVGSAGNYNISFVNGTLTLTTAPLQLTANSFSKQYGLTYSFTGTEYTVSSGTLYNGDTISSIALSSAGAAATATFVAPGPTYTITAGPGVTFSVGSAGNYSISFVNGTLTITQAPLTITATNRSKVFGATYTPDTTPPSVDFTVGTLYNGDSVTSITLTCAGYPASALPTPSGYTITPSAAVGTGLSNYTISYVTGTFTIGYGMCTGSNPGGVILPPINADGSSVYKRKAGSTIPVKFTVCGADGLPIQDPYAVFLNYPNNAQLTMLSRMRGTIDGVNEALDNDIPNAAFTFVGDHWQFNLATTTIDAGYTYNFSIALADGSFVTFTVALR